MKIKTIEQAKELGLKTHLYSHGDWEYKDADGYWHLFRNGEEVLPDVKKVYIHLFRNGDWEYEDTEGYYHLFRNGEELLPEVDKIFTTSYDDGDWEYLDTDKELHTIIGNNHED